MQNMSGTTMAAAGGGLLVLSALLIRRSPPMSGVVSRWSNKIKNRWINDDHHSLTFD